MGLNISKKLKDHLKLTELQKKTELNSKPDNYVADQKDLIHELLKYNVRPNARKILINRLIVLNNTKQNYIDELKEKYKETVSGLER